MTSSTCLQGHLNPLHIGAQKFCCQEEEAMTLQPLMLMALFQHGSISHITTADCSQASITQ